jgi:hypothetical protein
MQLRRDSACCEPACHEPLNGTSVSEIAERGPRASAAPLQVGCPPREYRASCDSTVVSHRLRGWLGESVPQQSVRRVTQDLLNRLVAGHASDDLYTETSVSGLRINGSGGPLVVLFAAASAPQKCGSGGMIPTNSTAVISFSSGDRRRKGASIEVPDYCANGHRLTPDNVRIEQQDRRWRCRQCGADRAAAFRDRQRTG